MGDKAKIGGILTIISGSIGVIGSLLAFAFIPMVRTVMTDPEFRDPAMTDAELELAIDFMIGFVTVMGVIGLLLSIFIIIAGVMAVKRKSWGLGLAGAIVSLFVFAPTGIPALIFIALGKPEFEPAKAFPPADPAPPGSF